MHYTFAKVLFVCVYMIEKVYKFYQSMCRGTDVPLRRLSYATSIVSEMVFRWQKKLQSRHSSGLSNLGILCLRNSSSEFDTSLSQNTTASESISPQMLENTWLGLSNFWVFVTVQNVILIWSLLTSDKSYIFLYQTL